MALLSFGAGGLVEASGDEVAAAIGFVSGFTLFTAQTSAPVGWTKSLTHNDKAIRLVNGAASSGGSNPFSASFASRTPTGTLGATSLSEAQLAAHNHAEQGVGGPDSPFNGTTWAFKTGILNGPNAHASAGSGSTHDHTANFNAMDFAVSYVDCIMIVRD